MKILLAVDDSKYSEAVAQAIVRQMRPEGAEVCVFHAIVPLLIISYGNNDLHQGLTSKECRLITATNCVTARELLLPLALPGQDSLGPSGIEGIRRISLLGRRRPMKANIRPDLYPPC
jgi:hypothetical protein